MVIMKLWTICLLLAAVKFSSGNPATLPPKHPASNAQFVHEKEELKPESHPHDDQLDPYRLTNDFRSEQPQQLQQPYPSWNPYQQNDNFAAAGRYLFGYPNPLYIPYPVFIQPESVYPFQGGPEDYDDPMSRANTRRPTSYRNSPIYYVRLPPTPYMFIPGLGYHSQPPTFTPSFSPLMPYNPMPALPVQPAINPFINLPLNFMSNGKPTNIYQLESSPMPQPPPQQYQPYIPPRPYRPSYAPQPSYMSPDSKITHLKRPFLFNGRPEDIYVLQSGFNPMYQSPIPGYY